MKTVPFDPFGPSYRKAVYATGWRGGLRDADLDDYAQDTFVVLLERSRRFDFARYDDPTRPWGHYVHTAAKWQLLVRWDRRRRRLAREAAFPSWGWSWSPPSPFDVAARAKRVTRVLGGLGELSPLQREIMLGVRDKEIATRHRLNCARVKRTRLAMQKRIASIDSTEKPKPQIDAKLQMIQQFSVGSEERWRAIPGYDGYEISTHGCVRSWLSSSGGNHRRSTPRMLATSFKGGARYVALGRGVGPRRIARLFADTFPEIFAEMRARGGDE